MGITITETRVQDQSSNDLNIEDIINIVYPVGSIYMSVNSTSPASLFGGTWERIKDRFLLAAGDTYSAGSTGGNAEHTHKYGIQFGAYFGAVSIESDSQTGVLQGGTGNPAGSAYYVNADSIVNKNATDESKTVSTSHYRSTADTSSASNMPPYLAVYVWKRVADEDFVVLSLQNGRLVMYRSKVSQYGINFILSNHKNLIVMHTDKVNFDIVDHQRLEVEYL